MLYQSLTVASTSQTNKMQGSSLSRLEIKVGIVDHSHDTPGVTLAM